MRAVNLPERKLTPGSTLRFTIDRHGSDKMLNCLMYKLCYYRFGQVYTEQGTASRLAQLSSTGRLTQLQASPKATIV
jgi:hypothetical protein